MIGKHQFMIGKAGFVIGKQVFHQKSRPASQRSLLSLIFEKLVGLYERFLVFYDHSGDSMITQEIL